MDNMNDTDIFNDAPIHLTSPMNVFSNLQPDDMDSLLRVINGINEKGYYITIVNRRDKVRYVVM